MRNIVFISVAKNHHRYFSQLIENTGLSGEVADWQAIIKHWRPMTLSAVTRKELKKITAEKIKERTLKNEKTSFLHRVALQIEIRIIANALSGMLRDESKTPAVGVWNGGHRYHKIAEKIVKSRGGTCFYFENGLLPGTTTLDTTGVNYENSAPRNYDFYLNYQPQSPTTQQRNLIPRKPRTHKGGAVKLPDNFFFIPFQDDRDTQVRNYSPWVKNMRDLFSKIQTISSMHSNVHFIFKEHPSSPASYPDLHEKETKNIIFANGNETQELIEKSKSVITLNSTVGLEAILLGKPVIVLGNAFYDIPGITFSASNSHDLSEIIENIESTAIDQKPRENFIAYLKEEYCIPGSWRNPDRNHWEAVKERITQHLDN